MILVWLLAGPEAWHEAAGVPGRVAGRKDDEAVECPEAAGSPTARPAIRAATPRMTTTDMTRAGHGFLFAAADGVAAAGSAGTAAVPAPAAADPGNPGGDETAWVGG